MSFIDIQLTRGVEWRQIEQEDPQVTGFDELDAMKKIADALEPLDDAARARALHWALSRFCGTQATIEPWTARSIELTADSANASEYNSFAELFDAANPTTEKDKALIAAYWIQICEGAPAFPAQTLNALLKDLGHGVGNITEALTALKSERPALVLQLKKGGTSRQARKTYKLTGEGAKRVAAITKLSFQSDEPS
ncbi:hypothetical protein [Bradyrhizobium sp.]|uniref:hypothetical protein n=1 Tax=Bradyrhizobium sp. TaxID=376 RepID=UPI0039E580CD